MRGGGGDSFEMIEWDDEGEYEGGGGGTLDRVVVNNWPPVYVRMYMEGEYVKGIAIMNDNDITQTKFIGSNPNDQIHSSFTNNPFHMVIENVWINTGTSTNDVLMFQNTMVHINDGSGLPLRGTWTSTVKPDNTRVELDCEVVENDGSFITAKCDSETKWPNSAFNRIPILVNGVPIYIGSNMYTNQVLFGTNYFSKKGSITQSWDGSTRYNVTGSGTDLKINNQFTIPRLPESFVNYWVNMGAEALLGKNKQGIGYAILVPPKSS